MDMRSHLKIPFKAPKKFPLLHKCHFDLKKLENGTAVFTFNRQSLTYLFITTQQAI